MHEWAKKTWVSVVIDLALAACAINTDTYSSSIDTVAAGAPTSDWT